MKKLAFPVVFWALVNIALMIGMFFISVLMTIAGTESSKKWEIISYLIFPVNLLSPFITDGLSWIVVLILNPIIWALMVLGSHKLLQMMCRSIRARFAKIGTKSLGLSASNNPDENR
ncbi:MAG TPA: hypothetical protein VHV83_17960 [Armatimonadota bacterium]|nr:hypothetical protein [Armatimonadota bacterium]